MSGIVGTVDICFLIGLIGSSSLCYYVCFRWTCWHWSSHAHRIFPIYPCRVFSSWMYHSLFQNVLAMLSCGGPSCLCCGWNWWQFSRFTHRVWVRWYCLSSLPESVLRGATSLLIQYGNGLWERLFSVPLQSSPDFEYCCSADGILRYQVSELLQRLSGWLLEIWEWQSGL